MIKPILQYFGLARQRNIIIGEHTESMVFTILCFKLVFWVAALGIDAKKLEQFHEYEYFVFGGVVVWFAYQMGVELWNNRSQLKKLAYLVPFWVFCA